MSNPAISGTNYAVVNALLQTKGQDEGWKYFEALNKNIDYYSNVDQIQVLRRQQEKLVLVSHISMVH